MKLSTLIANYDEFQSSYKKIGYSQQTINIRDKRQIRLLLSNVIDDIVIYNEILDIYDYTTKEKKQILGWLSTLGRKRETFIQRLVEVNLDNYYEDMSISDDDYEDIQLFESTKMLFKDKLDNKLYIDEGDSIFVNDWSCYIQANDYIFTIGWSNEDQDNYIIFPNGIKYTYSECIKASKIQITDENLKEAFMFVIQNFENIVKSIFLKMNYKNLLGINS